MRAFLIVSCCRVFPFADLVGFQRDTITVLGRHHRFRLERDDCQIWLKDLSPEMSGTTANFTNPFLR